MTKKKLKILTGRIRVLNEIRDRCLRETRGANCHDMVKGNEQASLKIETARANYHDMVKVVNKHLSK